jgi:hypothetical protein
VVPEQEGAAHIVAVPYSSQDPEPSHLPVIPQLAAPWATHVPLGSTVPAGRIEQLPAVPGTAHDTHVPLQADAQHKPCSQKPDAHSPAAAQGRPFCLGAPASPAAQPMAASTSAPPATVSAAAAPSPRNSATRRSGAARPNIDAPLS